jgi:NAD(P)-dependent dehydrogenase (short-subunit alcohol dehydrogenase family)
VLVARREERLRTLAEELAAEHGVRCEVIGADLGDEAERASLAARIDDLRAVPPRAHPGSRIAPVAGARRRFPRQSAWLARRIDVDSPRGFGLSVLAVAGAA